MLRTFTLFLFFTTQLWAQDAHTTVRITTKKYFHYEWTNEPSPCPEEEATDTSVAHCVLEVSYTYPQFATSDKNFTQLMNKAIRSTFDYSAPSSKNIKINLTNCPDDKPAFESMNYKIFLKSRSFLSVLLLKDYEPYGYGNGFRHDAIPFTFDLDNKKLLKLGDIIKGNSDTVIYRLIIAKIKASNPELFAETGEINNPELFQTFSTLDFPFVISRQSIRLYYSLSFGGKYSFEEIEIKLSENSELLADRRMLNLIQTRQR
jgi:hypothetical protein